MTGFARSITGFSRRLHITCHNRHTTIVQMSQLATTASPALLPFVEMYDEESDTCSTYSCLKSLTVSKCCTLFCLHATRSVC